MGGEATAATTRASREPPRAEKHTHAMPYIPPHLAYTFSPRSRRCCRIKAVSKVFIFLAARE
jgi:hypothetical protein